MRRRRLRPAGAALCTDLAGCRGASSRISAASTRPVDPTTPSSRPRRSRQCGDPVRRHRHESPARHLGRGDGRGRHFRAWRGRRRIAVLPGPRSARLLEVSASRARSDGSDARRPGTAGAGPRSASSAPRLRSERPDHRVPAPPTLRGILQRSLRTTTRPGSSCADLLRSPAPNVKYVVLHGLADHRVNGGSARAHQLLKSRLPRLRFVGTTPNTKAVKIRPAARASYRAVQLPPESALKHHRSRGHVVQPFEVPNSETGRADFSPTSPARVVEATRRVVGSAVGKARLSDAPMFNDLLAAADFKAAPTTSRCGR